VTIGEQKPCDQISENTDDYTANELREYLLEARRRTPDDSVLDYEITAKEIEDTYGLCSKTPGPDEVTTLMIDHADRHLMNVCLSRLWNTVWSTGKVPDQWKLEHRILLPKPGKDTYNECSSYRTVSVTAVLGKRFEKIVKKRLTCMLDMTGFDERQFAYLKNRSSTQAVLSLVEIVKANMLQGHVAGALFFDYTDAFGSVNRNKLLCKLCRDFGITGRMLLYLNDFLSGRQARIKVNDLIGEWMSSDRGTSAGTILGAILFIGYVHDAPKDIFPKFADDFAGIAIAEDIVDVEAKLQGLFNELL